MFGLAATPRVASSQKPAVSARRSSAGDQHFKRLAAEATQAREGNRVVEACQIYEQLVKLRPAWAEGWWYLGTLYHERGQFVAASVAFERFTALEPGNGQGWGLLGICEYKTREFSLALKHLMKARALGLGNNQELARSVRFHQAILLTRSRQFEEAMAILVGFGVEHRESPAVLDAMGASTLRIAEPVENLPPEKQEMVRLFGKATFLASERKLDTSYKLLEQLESRYRGQPNVAYVLGVALLLQNNPDKAIEYFKAELERDPNHVPALLRIAFRMLETNQFEQCDEYARKVMVLEPENYASYYLQGRVLFYSKEFPQAIALLEKAASLVPELASIQYALYEAYRRAGRPEDARRAREQFTRLDALEKQQVAGSPFSIESPATLRGENNQPGTGPQRP